MDTNYYRGAGYALLSELRGRGFRISISLNAFVEHWTRSVRDGNLQMLVSRAQRLKSIIDADTPLLPTGLQLVGLVGGRTRDDTPTRYDELMQWCRGIWKATCNGRVDDAQRVALATVLSTTLRHV